MNKWGFYIIGVLVSCSPEQKDSICKSCYVSEEIIPKDSAIYRLSTFTTVPEEIDGCACYFYLTKQDELNSKYIFVNDFANTAFISINDSLKKFKLKIYKDNTYIYADSLYNLKIEIIKTVNNGGENSIISGYIKLSKDSVEIQQNFVGMCGC